METTDQFELDRELNSKLEMLEKKVTKVIEKLHGYVKDNCAKASVREKCSTLTYDLSAEAKGK